uniref:DUF1080 domain-containing protein n=1 Tax=Streptomyces sp. NBC_00003 TaxID=2903608 RepID=A0AAU2VAW2_9ACTN
MTSAPRPRRPARSHEPGPRTRRLAGLALAAALIASLAFGISQCRADGHPKQYPAWADGSVHGRWQSVFNGHGTTGGDDRDLDLSPQPATDPGTTHAALVVSTAAYRNVDYRARMRTVRQLRTPKPNGWEVPWLVWAYTDPEHFYYIALKPNGWELGKRDPAYPGGQRFLATGQQPFPVGDWSSVRIEQRGARLKVAVDGSGLADFTDGERPYAQGRVGAYAEDARVEFRDVSSDSGS